jgi:hypothetical protein
MGVRMVELGALVGFWGCVGDGDALFDFGEEFLIGTSLNGALKGVWDQGNLISLASGTGKRALGGVRFGL